MKNSLLFLAAATLAGSANAQTVTNYWDFESTVDIVGGVPTTMIGTPDLSLNATYGEAYSGSNKSLNIILGGVGAGGGWLEGDVFDGVSATAMDFGTSDFSFSYWSYDDTTDGNTKGPRIFDWLDGTSTGVQCGTNATSIYNLRVDTSDGGASISNNTLGALTQPANTWTHIAVNVDRGNGQYEIFFNGTSQGIVPLSAPSAGSIHATRDMDIGVINSDGTQNQAEQSGLDDLAFYDGLLGASDITGLANGTLTPLNFVGSTGSGYCFGDGTATTCPCGNTGGAGEGCANSSGAGAILAETGTTSVGADDLGFAGTGLLPLQPALLFVGDVGLNGGNGVTFGDGLRCAGGTVIRLGTQTPDGTGAATWGPGLGATGGWAAGDTRYFQLWYRDPIGSPCGAGFNLTNGVALTFGS